ncbi:hypothetical protein ColTof4_05219 [Colletotrichum tofieldiae]|nr:hypothetical protein ColTof3_10531 [Colletotrichum tofieldiae]GKT72796.1 hypothetical protein ColTof4_05219 [Colletotrichum tofieldiae]GKT89360.1 hypothetical protein Ct61P_07210 [Colletotrichum tofieldiae]
MATLRAVVPVTTKPGQCSSSSNNNNTITEEEQYDNMSVKRQTDRRAHRETGLDEFALFVYPRVHLGCWALRGHTMLLD